jgi:transglutaminase-like putative cysteine protease
MRRSFFAFPFLFSYIFFFSCTDQQPRIHFINPRIGMMEEVLTILGENFGDTREESYITIAGISPTTSSYIEWSDTRILVRIPEFGDSGLVYVYRGDKKSNPALFSNRATMPQTIQEEYAGIGPRILRVEPQIGQVGSVVTITGSGFGTSREEGGVFFAWSTEQSAAEAASLSGPGSIDVSETEFGYELWSEREIRVRVPDGAIGGNLSVQTPRGNARPVFFDITKPGTKIFKEKRSYTISYSVDIQVEKAEKPNSLYLWLPRPVNSSSQRNVRVLSRNMEPFIENHRGTSLFQIKDLQSGANTGISLSYQVEVYAVETNIRSNSVPIASSEPSPIRTAYTVANSRLPSDDPRIKELTAALIGREQNPYIRARRIYEYLLNQGGIQSFPGKPLPPDDLLEALKEKKTDPYTATLLFCTMARSAGIPTIPVSGVLLNRNRTLSRHFWAEFWIDGFGWIPVDIALGAGAVPPSFILRADKANYYFGNLDNQRIAFSRGFTTLSQMDPRGRVSLRERDYALQNLWEEAVGGLESYSSLWSDITINGVYYQ